MSSLIKVLFCILGEEIKSVAFCPRVAAGRERPAGTSCGMQRKLNIYLLLLLLVFVGETLKMCTFKKKRTKNL